MLRILLNFLLKIRWLSYTRDWQFFDLKKLNSPKSLWPKKRNGQMNWTESFQRKKFKWLKNIRKNDHHPWSYRKCKSKTTLRFYLISVIIATINNSPNNKCWWGCGEKGTLIHCCWECKLGKPLWKTVRRLLKKLKIDLLYDPAILLLGIYQKDCESIYNKDTCTPKFIGALFTIVKLWKQPKCPITNEWIEKIKGSGERVEFKCDIVDTL
jgi:hypothetical protein